MGVTTTSDSPAASSHARYERLEDAELHRGHDRPGDPEPEEQLQHVVGIRDSFHARSLSPTGVLHRVSDAARNAGSA
jgi:hypothetical protein